MEIKEWGEENFIQSLEKVFGAPLPLLGIGDDCAVIPNGLEQSLLVTTDALVEGIHFLKEQIPPKELGYKAIGVNVSDIAAMGGLPKYAFLSLALPKSTDSDWLAELIQGIKGACEKWGILLLGGDTVGSKRDLFLNITLLGYANPSEIKCRHDAKLGDLICVTGHLGDSAGGFKALQSLIPVTCEVQTLINAHFHPEIDLKKSKWLAAQKGVHAMMDLSDGLDCDLKRLIKRSQNFSHISFGKNERTSKMNEPLPMDCPPSKKGEEMKMGAFIETTSLPISKALLSVCNENRWDLLDLSLFGGEDYQLLFTVAPEAMEKLHTDFKETFQSPLFQIGQITPSSSLLNYLKNGLPLQLKSKSFDHFDP